MIVTREDLDVRDNGPEMPKHMKEWGWQESDYDRYHASFTLQATRRIKGIVGSPLGRGRSEQEAIKDLLLRTNAESQLKLEWIELIHESQGRKVVVVIDPSDWEVCGVFTSREVAELYIDDWLKEAIPDEVRRAREVTRYLIKEATFR